MKTKDVRCPACKVRLSEGANFEVVIPYKGASSNFLAGVDDEGRLQLGTGDQGYPTWFGRPELSCYACGHTWTTSRRWT